ncbi:MAG: hypothetical protein M1549_02145 [Candidatus Dependentiae bacterium]|nr:hypothetical protein [Candidatus Dependentiae bacterium]
MSHRVIVLSLALAVFTCAYGAENGGVCKQFSLPTEQEELGAVSGYTVLQGLKALRKPYGVLVKHPLKKSEKIAFSREEEEAELTEAFWTVVSDHFSSEKSFDPTDEMAVPETVHATIELFTIFLSALATKKADLTPLHEALAQLSSARKLSALWFAYDLQAAPRFLNILAHALKDDLLALPQLRKNLGPIIAQCPYALTGMVWQKVGAYAGDRKVDRATLFPAPGVISVPSKDGVDMVDLTTGDLLEAEEEDVELTLEGKVDQGGGLDTLPWDGCAGGVHQTIRGNYVIQLSVNSQSLSSDGAEEKPKNDTDSLAERICLTKKFFAQIHGYSAAKRKQGEDMEGYFIDFEHNGDGRFNVHCPWEENTGIGWDELEYGETKMACAGDVIFAKGWNRIDALDIATGIHTIFESDYTIDDIIVSPDEKYIAICEDCQLFSTSCSVGSSSYVYHVFALSPSQLLLKDFIAKMVQAHRVQRPKYPPVDLYGSSYGVVAKVLVWLAMQALQGLAAVTKLFDCAK